MHQRFRLSGSLFLLFVLSIGMIRAQVLKPMYKQNEITLKVQEPGDENRRLQDPVFRVGSQSIWAYDQPTATMYAFKPNGQYDRMVFEPATKRTPPGPAPWFNPSKRKPPKGPGALHYEQYNLFRGHYLTYTQASGSSVKRENSCGM